MNSRIRRALAITLLVLSPAPAVWAGDSEGPASQAEDEEQNQRVAELIGRGIELRRGGDDVRALELFLQAEKLEPSSTRVQVHLAAVYQALGRWEEADRYLSLATRNPEDAYVRRHQAVLASARRAVDQHMGSLQLSGGPAGTEVWLNGKSIGTLPIEEIVRIEAGIYTIEARRPGYYPITRSVALAGGGLTRETIQLRAELRQAPSGTPEEQLADRAQQGPRWLGWAFGGLAVGAGAATVAAWAVREQHVKNWNDDGQCLRPGETRGEVCADERRQGDRAQTWMWISGAAAGAFAAASAVTFWLTGEESEAAVGGLGCGVGLGSVSCLGRF